MSAAAACACSQDYREAALVRDTVREYNRLLTEGYRIMNMDAMLTATTPEQAAKLYYHMAALGEGGVRMLSELRGIRFDEVTFSKPDKAAVRTTETWDFVHADIATGEVVFEKRDFVYRVAYELEKTGGKWKVVSVVAEGEGKEGREVGEFHPRLDRAPGAAGEAPR